MATVPLPPRDAEELKRHLYDVCRIGVLVIRWGGRQFVRVSVQGYNRIEDVEMLLHLEGARGRSGGRLAVVMDGAASWLILAV